jgi:biotin-dependent carboxylase-like uncharacterized protein
MTEPAGLVEVVRPGPLTTIQDCGRFGYAHLGVPRSGALDGPALAAANRLVGNTTSAAGLETTVGGVALRAARRCWVAVTGAAAEVTVDGQPVLWGQAVELAAGQVLVVGPARQGLRSYVAISGGIAVEPVLGSRSTDLLSGLGPPPLRAGDVLPLGPPAAPPPTRPEPMSAGPPPEPIPLHLALGPRHDWFTDAAVRTLLTETYVVSTVSNRIALRLDGPRLARSRPDELPSEGVVLGAVQVPADGRPLVFLHDHPTVGGYPVVGVLEPPDLAHCAQARPGAAVRFHVAATAPGYGAPA